MTRGDIGDTLAFVNALLNGSSACLLLLGRVAVARRNFVAHRAFMLGALLGSALFLTSYLTRVALTGTHADPHHGWVHTLYLAVLISHMILAVTIVPLILRTLWLAYKKRFKAHRALAAVTFPMWVYVSVTGVVVYAMLYHLPA